MAGQIDGAHDVPLLAFNSLPGGADLGQAMLVPPSGNVFFVRGSGGAVALYDYDPPGVRERLNASVNAALGQCVGGRGDVIMVLEGHAENVATADAWSNIKAGVKIIGRGYGTSRPTFTFTVDVATLLIDVANVAIVNCRFMAAGPAGTTAITVVAPITWSGAGGAFVGNQCQVGIDADQLCTGFFATTAAADDLVIARNEVYGAAASTCTYVFKFVGADRLKFIGNKVTAGTSAVTTGLLYFEVTASTDILIADNLLHCNSASSDTCIGMSENIANSGWLVRNFCRNMSDAITTWITSAALSDMQLMDNYGINNSNERGVAIGVASI